ncbi:hypothetical protein B0H12DRAFT_1111377 [Mycena haematopus]|nr:hypothetical protein B0H12DRAFT_1111377 [Mycena haematopus]
MFFHRIRFFFGFFLLFLQCQQVSALTFAPIVGPFVTGARVPIEWTLDGFEPSNGWELWFNAGGFSTKLLNVPPLTVSAVVAFPGSNGVFQGLSGTTVLATSNEVDLAATGVTATTTFSASVVSGSATVTSVPSRSSTAGSPTPSKSSAFSTAALLGIAVGTLAVIAVIVLASVSLFVYRRRRVAATSRAYPFNAADVEKQLALKITPFDPDARGPPPPPRGSSLPQPPPPAARPSQSDLRRQAYLNSQLDKLEASLPSRSDPESGSIVFGPLSSVPSESMPRPFDREAESPPLPPIPDVGSRRAAYLAEQLLKLTVADRERRPSDGSVVFGPLSSVPSESTAPSISTVGSPIQFLRTAPRHITSPVSPPTRRPPW